MEESKIRQEYFCSWEGGLEGAYFTEEVNDIRNNRLGHFANDDTSAMTAWDIGVADKTAIGVFKRHPQTGDPVLMDAYEDRNKGLSHYIKQIRRWQDEYLFDWHFGPHDLHKTDFATGTRMVDRASDMGLSFDVLERPDLADSIDNLRAFLRRLHVNENDRTIHVLDMLSSYRREYDSKHMIFKEKPVHDFASDSTDMMRYAAMAYDPNLLKSPYDRRVFKSRRAIGR
jgi:phage terminase large subunit